MTLKAKKKRFIAFEEITMAKLVAISFILPWWIVLVLQGIYLWSNKAVGGDMSSLFTGVSTTAAIVASGYFGSRTLDYYTGYRYGDFKSQYNDTEAG